MRIVIPFVASCAVLLTAGLFLSSRPASGQGFAKFPPTDTAPFGGNYAVQVPGAVYGQSGAPHDPELHALLKDESKAAEEAAALMKEYAGTDNEEKRAKIKTKLGEALGKQFDLQQKRRDLE
jgi:hypothetical protein